MKAKIVIGACFGDEGKGLMTDYLCSPHGTTALVVRFNGGAQAGHTVATDKQRHVFHHLGSGSLAGAATYLSKYFITNPLLWDKEVKGLGFSPECIVDPGAPLTTPYDMLINQEVERHRGEQRHGSCGIGINETIERIDRDGYVTCAADVLNLTHLKEKLLAIRESYVLPRLTELGMYPSAEFLDLLHSESLAQAFMDASLLMSKLCSFSEEDHIRQWDCVVFEGAQGLLLDQSHNFFPHVTRSNTGIQNAAEIAERQSIELEAFYVTRTYLTRHGAGPFPTENTQLSYRDNTNRPNDWQRSLRFGPLDAPLIAEAIKQDLRDIPASLVVTHADQESMDNAHTLANLSGLTIGTVSRGPQREAVTKTLARSGF